MIDFLVIVPFHNAAAFLPECLDSIASQRGEFHARGYLVDDASTDGWQSVVPSSVTDPGAMGFLAVTTPERGEELASIVAGTALANRDVPLTNETVIVHVCGDDALAGPDALGVLADIYQDPDVWMTYGSFAYHGQMRSSGFCKALPPQAHQRGDYRARPWVTSHLRSYRVGLWRSIPPEQLIDPTTGRLWQYGTDFAFMLPMLELARERARFVPDVLYLYRKHENNIPPSLYGDPCRRIRAMPRLARMDKFAGVS